jgi:hypothetical protein
MAFQKGIIKLKGRIGDLTFYKTRNNGFQAREKTGVDANRIATDPKFQRTRENNAEFGRAVKGAKLFSTIFRDLIVSGADPTCFNRLTTSMVRVVKADSVNDRGERMVLDAETELLLPFEFNAKAQVSGTVLLQFSGNIDRATGKLKVSIPEFIPKVNIVAPEGATHFRFKAAAAMINFENELDYQFYQHDGHLMPFDNTMLQASTISCSLPPQLAKPLFLTFGIDFYQMVNGKRYPLNNGANNGLCLLQISGT